MDKFLSATPDRASRHARAGRLGLSSATVDLLTTPSVVSWPGLRSLNTSSSDPSYNAPMAPTPSHDR